MKNNGNGFAGDSKNGYELPKRVAIAYSEVKRDYFPTEAQYLTEKEALRDAQLIGQHLEKMGVIVTLIPGDKTLPARLEESRPEMVINLVDSVRGREDLEPTVPAALELMRIPYTGAGILGTSLGHNKFLVKKLLEQSGVPIPQYQLFNSAQDPLDPRLRFPLIAKLNEIHGGVEITRDAVSDTEKHLRERLKFLIKTYNQPVIVEEFIVGREVTATVLEGFVKKVYLAEKVFIDHKDKYEFVTFEMQWLTDEYAFRYERFKDEVLEAYVKRAFEVVAMADYGKFDVRVDAAGRYYFIDSNCNPAFGPKETQTALSVILDLYGINFYEILKRLLLNTMRDMALRKYPRHEDESVEEPAEN